MYNFKWVAYHNLIFLDLVCFFKFSVVFKLRVTVFIFLKDCINIVSINNRYNISTVKMFLVKKNDKIYQKIILIKKTISIRKFKNFFKFYFHQKQYKSTQITFFA